MCFCVLLHNNTKKIDTFTFVFMYRSSYYYHIGIAINVLLSFLQYVSKKLLVCIDVISICL